MFLYAVLASPMVLSFDLATLDHPSQAFAKIFMNKDIVAINQDVDGTMGSKIFTRGQTPVGTEIWIKPLSDGSFAIAMLHVGADKPATMELQLDGDGWGDTSGELFPRVAVGQTAFIYSTPFTRRSRRARTRGCVLVSVPQMDGRLFRVNFTTTARN